MRNIYKEIVFSIVMKKIGDKKGSIVSDSPVFFVLAILALVVLAAIFLFNIYGSRDKIGIYLGGSNLDLHITQCSNACKMFDVGSESAAVQDFCYEERTLKGSSSNQFRVDENGTITSPTTAGSKTSSKAIGTCNSFIDLNIAGFGSLLQESGCANLKARCPPVVSAQGVADQVSSADAARIAANAGGPDVSAGQNPPVED